MSSERTPDATASSAGATFESCALALGFVSAEQAAECRAVHHALLEMGLPGAIEDIFLRKGYLAPSQVLTVAAALGRSSADAIPGYAILEKIGEGGMGAVFKARQLSMDRLVALKVLLPKFADTADGRERFLREARAVAKLSHPNVVAGIDAGAAHGVYYFVMEYLDGESADRMLRRCERLPWREATAIVRQIVLALEHATEHGIVHRDIKPANIMLLKDGRAKLADLGLARVAATGDSTLTQSGMIVGSPAYLSPEQATAESETEVDVRSDIYSLGLTWFELVTGECAFAGANPMSVLTRRLTRDVPLDKLSVADAPRDLADVLAHMTGRAPEHRYQTPGTLLEDIDALLAGTRPVHARAAASDPARAQAANQPLPRMATRARASRAWPYLAAAGASLALLVSLWPRPGGEPESGTAAVPATSIQSIAPQPVSFGLIEAIERAQVHAGGARPFHAELERDKYSIDFARGNTTLNVMLDGNSGAVLEVLDEDDEDHSTDVAITRITLIEAVQAAQRKVPGTAVDAEILLLPGRPVIAVKLLHDGARVVVNVDGSTGDAQVAASGSNPVRP